MLPNKKVMPEIKIKKDFLGTKKIHIKKANDSIAINNTAISYLILKLSMI